MRKNSINFPNGFPKLQAADDMRGQAVFGRKYTVTPFTSCNYHKFWLLMSGGKGPKPKLD